MSPAWRFYYFDLERINASIVQNQASKVIAEEYVKVKKKLNFHWASPS